MTHQYHDPINQHLKDQEDWFDQRIQGIEEFGMPIIPIWNRDALDIRLLYKERIQQGSK